MQISSNHSRQAAFGAVPIKELKVGETYIVNTLHHNPKRHGAEIIFEKIENRGPSIIDAIYKFATGEKRSGLVHGSNGAIRFIDKKV